MRSVNDIPYAILTPLQGQSQVNRRVMIAVNKRMHPANTRHYYAFYTLKSTYIFNLITILMMIIHSELSHSLLNYLVISDITCLFLWTRKYSIKSTQRLLCILRA